MCKDRAGMTSKLRRVSQSGVLFNIAFSALALAVIVFMTYFLLLYQMTRPNQMIQTRSDPGYQFVAGNEVLTGSPPYFDNQQLYIPVTILKEHYDVPIHIEESEEASVLIWTSTDHVIEMRTPSSEIDINQEPLELRVPTQTVAGEFHLPSDFVSELTNLCFETHEETQRVLIRTEGEPIATGVVIKAAYPAGTFLDEILRRWSHVLRTGSPKVYVRAAPDPQSAILKELEIGDSIEILGEEHGWLLIQAKGMLGYLPQTDVQLRNLTRFERDKQTADPTSSKAISRQNPRARGERINLVWEHVSRQTPDPETIGELPGVNVVSPTWFALADEKGRFHNQAERRYVEWAHSQGMLVWGLASNSFDPDLTSRVLANRETRRTMINQLLAFASIYNLDGINIDFENVYYEDRDLLTQFMRELTPVAHQEGLTISIDVTMISTSPTWSMCYDRPALADIVDYVMLMGYDEHYAASPVAGSVASLPWVERGLQKVLEEIPAHKLILGIPFYTRIWEEWTEGDQKRLKSHAIGMARQQDIIATYQEDVVWDDGSGQHYLKYEEDDRHYQIWIEDEHSLRARLNLVHRYHLAGSAAWRRGLECPSFWPIIDEALRWWP